MTIYHSVPPLLAAAEAKFSTLLRARNSEEGMYSPGISLYRKIVRENISGVLLRVFPLFCRRLNEIGIQHLVESFLQQHQASQPEFHQLATELLIFIRQQPGLPAEDLALIEYEWLLYAVEIDDSAVPFPQRVILNPQNINNVKVKINPTMKIIVLPFRFKDEELCYETGQQVNYYVIYRKYNHCVYRKRLSQTDVQMLSQPGNHDIYMEPFWGEGGPVIPYQSWLETNNNDELLSLIIKG